MSKLIGLPKFCNVNPTIKHTDINKPLKPANDDNIIIAKIAT